MQSRIPRPVLIALIVLVVVALVTGVVLLIQSNYSIIGWILAGLLIAALVLLLVFTVPHLYKLYKFQKYFKQHEDSLNVLPGLMSAGKKQEAIIRFESVMKDAPESAYVYYLRAFFFQAAERYGEAMSAASKALTLASRDPFLPILLQQTGGQMGQPSTLEGFREQLEELRRTLEPRVNAMRERHEKAVSKRKKKSR